MVDTQLAYANTYEVMDVFKRFINNTLPDISGSPIVDPFSDSNKTRGTGTGLAVLEDETLSPNHPKITLETIDLPRDRMAGGKTAYRKRVRTIFAIRYECMQGHKWTRNNIEYKGKQQCIAYLQYLADQIDIYSNTGSFVNFNEISFGTISNPSSGKQTGTYEAFLPVKIDSYGRVGA